MRDAPDGTTAAPDATVSAGSTIGSFTLLQPLGEGGMGEVWEAEQREPIRRHVALKLLKLGLDTKAFLARFEVERQALAVMDHPNIAKVLETGATPSGRPYYAMELVRGIPLTDFCDTHHLTTRQRLELFASVCRAVQHAHQKGVIHRDLKPSNVLVTYVDDVPMPKVIDFGIAKAMGAQLTNVTFVTEFGRPLGTPAYMSPEQWEPGQVDIDTRSDIYSLGVMLYELLVGRLPNDANQMMQAGLAIAQMLRDVTPPSPSTRVRSLGSDTGTLAKARGTDPRSLARELKGDLDWITLKAIDPDRRRRYETAHALAQDVMRHLHDEPVLARPPSVGYRTGRFVRRNRMGVAVAAVAMLAIVTFTGITVVQARRLAVERDRAQVEAARAGALSTFLQRTLLSPDPIAGTGRQTTMLEALDSAAARLDRERPKVPAVAATMESAIGWAYFKLGMFDRAEPLLTRALATRRGEPGADSLELAESLVRVGSLHHVRARPDSAAQYFTDAIGVLRRHGAGDDAELAETLSRAGNFFRERGDSLNSRRALDEARAIVARGDDSLALSDIDENLAALAYDGGDYSRADTLFRRALAYRRTHLGDHALVANTLQNWGATLEKLNLRADAESAYREALRIAERTLGPQHEVVSAIATNLGSMLDDQGRRAEAEPFLRRAVSIDEQTFGAAHPFVASDLTNLARLLCRAGKAQEGEALARRSARIFAKDAGAASWQVAVARTIAGACLGAQRRFVEGESELLTGLQGIKAALGPTHWRADTARVRLKDLYLAWGKPALAESAVAR